VQHALDSFEFRYDDVSDAAKDEPCYEEAFFDFLIKTARLQLELLELLPDNENTLFSDSTDEQMSLLQVHTRDCNARALCAVDQLRDVQALLCASVSKEQREEEPQLPARSVCQLFPHILLSVCQVLVVGTAHHPKFENVGF